LRRKYKLMLIILLSGIITYLIYIFNIEKKINVLAMGDGIASGMTAYHIEGISFNDYLKDYLDANNKLRKFIDISRENYQINDLINNIEKNTKESNDKYINQLIHQANIITIAIGEDELTKSKMTNDLNEENIKKFLNNFEKLLKLIKKNSDAKIVVVGLYENHYLDKKDVIILNSEIANIVDHYNEIFINVADLLLNKELYLNNNSYYFSYRGHENIAQIILNSV